VSSARLVAAIPPLRTGKLRQFSGRDDKVGSGGDRSAFCYVSRLSTASFALRKQRSLLKKALALWMSFAI
jgi:hypothetical protein